MAKAKKMLSLALAVLVTVGSMGLAPASAATKKVDYYQIALTNINKYLKPQLTATKQSQSEEDLKLLQSYYRSLKIHMSKITDAKKKAAISKQLMELSQEIVAVTAQVKAQVAAADAVEAFELAALETAEDIAKAEELYTAAYDKVQDIADRTVRVALMNRINDKKVKLDAAKKALADKEAAEKEATEAAAKALKAAEDAVAAYEAAKLTTLDEVKAAKDLEAKAAELVAKVSDAAKKEALEKRIAEQKTKVDAAEVALTPLKVESVSAINAKQVKIKFTKAVDETTVGKSKFVVLQEGDAAGYDRLTDSTTATNTVTGAVPGSGLVQVDPADKTTVILTVDRGARFTNGKTVTVKVTGIKDVNGNTITDETVTAKLWDTTVPTMVKAESIGSNQVKVTFSEPVWNGSNDDYTTDLKANFVINDGLVAIANVYKSSTDPNALIFTTAANLTKDAEYTIKNTTTAIQDYAGYSLMQYSTIKFTHTVNTVAPTVSAEAKSEYKVRLTFDKAVTIPSTSNIEFRYAYNLSSANKTTAASGVAVVNAAAGNTDTQFDVTLPNPMLPGEGTLYIHYVSTSNPANLIYDSFGNVLPNDTAVKFTVAVDTTAPTATVAYYDPTHIDVTFSEPVYNADQAISYEIRDKYNTELTITNISLINAVTNKYRLTLGSAMSAGDYTVKITDRITDTSIYRNKFATQTFTLTVPDTVKPLASAVKAYYNAAGDKIIIYYNEEMGASALDVNNYRLSDGTSQYALPTGTTITQVGSVVTISLPKTLTALATDLSSGALNRIFIGAVADKAGNVIDQMKEHSLTSLPTTFTFALSSVKLLSGDKVSFKVDRNLKSVDPTKISYNSNTATTATVVNGTDGKATVTAYFAANSLPTVPTGSLVITDGAFVDLNDLTSDDGTAGSTFTFVGTVYDYAAPKISTIVTADSDGNGHLDQVVVTFSEGMYAASFQESDFTVEGYTIDSIVASGTTLTINLVEKAAYDTAETPKVTLVGEVEDANRNALGAQDGIYAVDNAKVSVTSVAFVNGGTSGSFDAGDKVVITFSEAVDPRTLGVATLTAGGTAVANVSLASILGTTGTIGSFATTAPAGTASVALSADGKTLTITVTTATTAPAGNFTVNTSVQDLAGNAADNTNPVTQTGSF